MKKLLVLAVTEKTAEDIIAFAQVGTLLMIIFVISQMLNI